MIDELVGRDGEPRADLAVRPLDAHLGRRRRPEPDVDPAELAAGVAATDRQLARGRHVADPDLDPGPDRVAVRARLREAQRRASGPSRPALPPCPPPTLRQTRDRRRQLTSTRSSRPSRLRSARAAPRPRSKSTMPGRLGRLRRTSRRAGRGAGCSGPACAKSGCASTLPFEMNRSMKPSLLTSSNSGCQAVDGRASPPANGRVGVDAALERRCRGTSAARARRQGLEPVRRPGWSGRPPGSRRRSGPGSRCPSPRSGIGPSRRPPCTGAAARPARSRQSCSWPSRA